MKASPQLRAVYLKPGAVPVDEARLAKLEEVAEYARALLRQRGGRITLAMKLGHALKELEEC